MFCQLAWNEVSPLTIQNCCQDAGIVHELQETLSSQSEHSNTSVEDKNFIG